MHRLREVEVLLDRFSRENQRLTLEVDQLRSRRQYVDHDYRSEPFFAQAGDFLTEFGMPLGGKKERSGRPTRAKGSFSVEDHDFCGLLFR